MFTTVAPTDPAAAWFNVNDPIKDFDRIQKLVRDGFLVRTRADADTVQARANDTTQRDKALASGAQFVCTDYPQPDHRLTDLLCPASRRGSWLDPIPLSATQPWVTLTLKAESQQQIELLAPSEE